MKIDKLMDLLKDRRNALQEIRWLRPVLYVIDFVLLLAGLFISPVLGIVLGLLVILLNHLLTPVIVRRIYFKDLGGELRPTGTLTTEVIHHAASTNTEENQDQSE